MTILENWDEVSKAQEVAADSLGSTERKYGAYMDSIEAHLAQLQTAWSKFLMNLEASGAANQAIDAIKGLVTILDVLINKTPAATILLTALAAALIRLSIIKLANLGTQIITLTANLTSLANGATGLTKFGKLLQAGLKSIPKLLLGVSTASTAAAGATAAAAEGTAVAGAAGFTAAGGFAALGASLTTILPPLLAIIGIGAAIYGVVKLVDDWYESEEELKESISTTQDNIDSLNTSLEEYKKNLTENTNKYIELKKAINNGTATDAQKQEAANLEQQNTLLTQQITLMERKLEIEQEQLKSDNSKLFEKQFKNVTPLYSDGRSDNDAPMGVQRAEQEIEKHNQIIERYEKEKEKLLELSQTEGSTSEAYLKQEEKVEKQRQLAIDSEEELNTKREELLGQMPYLTGENAKLAESIKSVYDNAYLVDSPYRTWLDLNNSLVESNAEVAETTETMEEYFTRLAGMEFKPKGVDSLNEWLNTLSNVQLGQLEDVFIGLGNNANILAGALNNMSGAESIDVVTEAYKRFYGVLDDAETSINEFEAALNTDYGEQWTSVAKAAKYIDDSVKNGITNFDAYEKALNLVFGTTNMTVEEAKNNLQNFNKFLTSDGSFSVDSFMKEIEKVDDSIASLTRNNEGKVISFDIKDVRALSDELGISESALQSMFTYLKTQGKVNIGNPVSALEKSVSQAKNDLTEIQEKLKNPVSFNLHTEEGVKEFDKVKDEINSIVEQTFGIKLNLDTDSFDTPYEVNKILQQINDSFNADGSINLDGFKKAFESSIDSIDYDTMTITFKEGMLSAFENDESGINAIIAKEAQAAGYNFQGSGAEAGKTFSSGFQSQVDNILGTKATAWSGVLADMAEDIPELGNLIKTNVTEELENINNQNYTGTYGKELKSQLSQAKTEANSLRNQLLLIAQMKPKVTVQVTKKFSSTPSTDNETEETPEGFPDLTIAANGRRGDTIRQLQNANVMTGEEGTELIIRKNGQQELVGEKGIEFAHVNAGDSILPHDVTEKILNGDIKPRGAGENGEKSSSKSSRTSSGYTSASGSSSIGFGGSLPTGDTSYGNSSSSSSSSSNKSSSSSSRKSSSSSNSDVDAIKEAAEEEIRILKHKLNMEFISQKQYYNSLDAINKKYYYNKAKYQEEDWALREELFNLEKDFQQEWFDAQEHAITGLTKKTGTEQQQIAIYKKMQDRLHAMAESYRKRGFEETSSEIVSLQKEWWNYYDEINSLQEQMFENMISESEHYVTMIESQLELLPEFIDVSLETSESLSQRLQSYFNNYMSLVSQQVIQYKNQYAAIQAEIEKLTIAGYDKNKERIFELEEQALSVKKSILDIYSSVKDLQLENVGKEISYQDRIVAGLVDIAEDYIKDYEEENEKLQEVNDSRQEEIEKLQEQQEELRKLNENKKEENELEKLQQDLQEAKDRYENAKKNRKRRVYHQETGWVWEADQDAIKEAEEAMEDAQEAIDDYETEKAIDAIQDQIDAIQDQIDATDEQIDANNKVIDNWNDYIEKLNQVSSEYEKQINRQLVELEYGKDVQQQVWEDMNNNLGLSIDDAVGMLDDLIDKYDELYEKQQEISERPPEDFEEDFDDDVDDTDDEYDSYDPDFDYQAEINRLEKLLQDKYDRTGKWDKDIQRQIEVLNKKRQDKIEGEGLTLDDLISAADRRAIEQAKADYLEAKARGDKKAMQEAHDRAEAIRNKYGFTGGEDGSDVRPFDDGGIVDYTGLAMVHGSNTHSEVTFNSKDANKLWKFVHSLSNSTVNVSDILKSLNTLAKNLTKSDTTSETTIHIGNLNLPQVKNNNDFVKELQLMSLNR